MYMLNNNRPNTEPCSTKNGIKIAVRTIRVFLACFFQSKILKSIENYLYLRHVQLVTELTVDDTIKSLGKVYKKGTATATRIKIFLSVFSHIHCFTLNLLGKPHWSFEKIWSKKGHTHIAIHKPFAHFTLIWENTNASITFFISFIILFKRWSYVNILHYSWKRAT